MKRLHLVGVIVALGFAAVGGLAGSARANWIDINVLQHDNGGQKCTNGAEFAFAFFGPSSITITVTNDQTGQVYVPTTTLSTLIYNPVPELAPEPFLYSNTFRVLFSPQPAVGEQLVARFVRDGFSMSSVGWTIGACTLGDPFAFKGKVDDPPAVNEAKPGETIKVKWKSPFAGLGIFSEGPTVATIPCSPPPPGFVPNYQPMPASGTLEYHDNHYTYEWNTQSSWRGCRQLFFRLTTDGLVHRANFNFG